VSLQKTNSEQTPDADNIRWFNETVHPHEPLLRAYLIRRFPLLKSEMDDLIQETYLRILKAKRLGKDGLNRAYLFVIARNAGIDLFRRRKMIPINDIAEIDRLTVVMDGPNAAESASHRQELEILSTAIASLPTRCREIFVLRRFEGYSHQEIARRLGITENTVNAHLVTAMLKIRAHLRAEGLTGNHKADNV